MFSGSLNSCLKYIYMLCYHPAWTSLSNYGIWIDYELLCIGVVGIQADSTFMLLHLLPKKNLDTIAVRKHMSIYNFSFLFCLHLLNLPPPQNE